ncbi:hypothetical protein Taro_009004 [Colocasia esculenta]|uniref:Uncharacterized protein n=1 Tax=Colocasia esculenta TaxID=4460 RepID=A0A843TYZ6_COLES|nr:hypothetical protein [Colocasia esculenta]
MHRLAATWMTVTSGTPDTTLMRRPAWTRQWPVIPDIGRKAEKPGLTAGLFSIFERDGGARHLLIATLGDVVFWLPLFWLVVCMHAVCRARDRRADFDMRIATGSRVATWSQQLPQALLGQGRFCLWDSGRFELVDLGWSCSRREDHVYGFS